MGDHGDDDATRRATPDRLEDLPPPVVPDDLRSADLADLPPPVPPDGLRSADLADLPPPVSAPAMAAGGREGGSSGPVAPPRPDRTTSTVPVPALVATVVLVALVTAAVAYVAVGRGSDDASPEAILAAAQVAGVEAPTVEVASPTTTTTTAGAPTTSAASADPGAVREALAGTVVLEPGIDGAFSAGDLLTATVPALPELVGAEVQLVVDGVVSSTGSPAEPVSAEILSAGEYDVLVRVVAADGQSIDLESRRLVVDASTRLEFDVGVDVDAVEDFYGTWVSILSSQIVESEAGRGDALAQAQALAAGRGARVLDTNLVPSLRDDIYIVYEGVFATRLEAQHRCWETGARSREQCVAAPISGDPVDPALRFAPVDPGG
ncbi:MAG: hypothetical protein AAGA17_06195 [Actinomycetota bacterium]